ncbi:hypothetical protein B9Z19DRAFT_1073372 [Tuber borchii]|uniref:Uncharacterized protein n=1 Tax=Tuber borchii TaxID=42251 RepID=A0A2T7A5R2_TUBBO|nr:hypothetical protein B9Z19DRAFT_1073372 [Tuber borchii]
MLEGSRNPSQQTVCSPLSNDAANQSSQPQGARAQDQDGLIHGEQQEYVPQSRRQTTYPATGSTSSFEPGQASQPYGGQQHQPASGEPPSPAMTISDVHGARSRSSSIASTSSGAGTQLQRLGFQNSPMLIRYMTLGSEEPLRHEANIAIQGGFVRDGENMVHRRGMEEGWPSVSESGVSENTAESSVTLGREVIEDGMPNEQSIDG